MNELPAAAIEFPCDAAAAVCIHRKVAVVLAALAAATQYALREGLIASVPEFVVAYPTFPPVRRAIHVLERLGARFAGPLFRAGSYPSWHLAIMCERSHH